MTTLIFAATDTTSNGLTRILYLLALNPDAQNKLRDEILNAQIAKQGDEIPYDELVSLPFLDAICKETLRLAQRDAILPLATPIKGRDGREISEITVPNNTTIIVSIYGTNRDPLLWGQDAHKWKPERWMAPLPDALVNAHVPGIYSNTQWVQVLSARDEYVLEFSE
ncbi:hypothetical protein DXG01_008501 [Tephrocybe rancida]|nr:hypothetical protein DXG01_008501 [Tephrocybe rancida]